MVEQRAVTWQGGGSPFGIGTRQLGMWLFVVSDLLTFSTLLVCYTYLRLASPNWPMPFHIWPSIVQASAMTLILLASSLTMVLAVEAMHRGDRRRAVRMILLTILCGIAFLAIHIKEWLHLLRVEGISLASNPWNEPLFGATFFGLTGLHMAHVTAGVVYLSIVGFGVWRGRYEAAQVETSGLYWHFVDLIWMFIFPLVYLMSVKL